MDTDSTSIARSRKNIWGGANARSNSIRHLDEFPDFESFVASLHTARNIGITRPAYLALPKENRDELKNGPYFMATSFSSPQRKMENAADVQLIVLDIDEEHPLAFSLGAEIVKDPTVLNRLDPYAWVCYTSANHTPKSPRFRIVVDACLPVADHKQAALYIADRLGLPPDWKGRKESTTAVLPMYFPITFAKEETHSPVVGFSLGGERLTLLDLPELVEGGVSAKDNEFFEILDSPISIFPQDLEECLNFINPDCSRENWIQVGCGLKHQYREDTAKGYAMFLAWSRKGSGKFVSDEDCRIQWASIKPTTKDRKPITARTIIRLGKQAGWKEGEAADRSNEAFMRWLAGATKNQLIAEGATRIAATLDESAIARGDLTVKLKAALKRFDVSVNLHSLSREVSRAAATEKRKDAEGHPPVWLQPWVFIAAMKAMVNRITGRVLQEAQFNGFYDSYMMELGAKVDGSPTQSAWKHALNVVQVPKAMQDEYDPSQPSRSLFIPASAPEEVWYNTWRPGSCCPDPEEADVAGTQLLELLRLFSPIPEETAFMLDFLAHLIQRPGTKIRFALLIQSVQGIGKTLLTDILRAMIGNHNVMSVGPKAHAGGWNEWVAGYEVVVLEELRAAGENPTAIMDALKQPIANDTVTVTQKYHDAREVRNVTNYIAFSNHKDAAHFSNDGDRRYYVVASPATPQIIRELADTGFFKRLERWKTINPGAMKQFLLSHKISREFSADGPPPITKAFLAMQSASASPEETEYNLAAADEDNLLIWPNACTLSGIKMILRARNSKLKPETLLQRLNFSVDQTAIRVAGVMTQIWVRNDGTKEDILKHEKIDT